MFWGSIQEDLQIMLFMIGVSSAIGLFVFVFTRKNILSLLIFSVLGNLSVYLTFVVGSFVFRVYNLFWLRDFARFYWPVINVILLIILIINYYVKHAKNKK